MKTIEEYLNLLEMCVSHLSGDKNVVEEYASQLEVEFEDFLVTHRLEFHNRSLAEETFISRLESPETIAESLLGVSSVDSVQLDSSHQLRKYFAIFIVFLAGIVTSTVIFYQFYVFEIPIQFPFFLLIPFLGVASFGIFLFFFKTISLEKRILTAFSVIIIIIISLAVFHNYIAPTFLTAGDGAHFLGIEIVSPSDYRVTNGLFFNMSDTALDECPILHEMVVTLIAGGTTTDRITREISGEELECVDTLLISMSGERKDLDTFYYQDLYFSVGFMAS